MLCMWVGILIVEQSKRIGIGAMPMFTGRARFSIARLLGATAALLAITLILTSPGWAASPCPNSQLRAEDGSTQLPDCRAYEMVSPSYTAGFNIDEPSVRKSTSELGPSPSFGTNAFLGESFGVFAGAENDPPTFGNQYLFSRSPSGWTTTPVDPPSAEFPDVYGAVPVIGSDLRFSLWEMGTAVPGSTLTPNRDFYLRDPAGTFTTIGPSAPIGSKSGTFRVNIEPEIMGASGDLSHLLFTSTDQVEGEPSWPEDETLVEKPSLYEYVGTQNPTPTMVGVTTGVGSHNLISQCGTSLGGNTETNGAEPVYNAVSDSGAVIFFSAAAGGCFGFNPFTETEELGKGPLVRELYARINDVETVAISEPTAGLGGDCEACQEGSQADANFQAASTAGSRVLFTTEQELLPENPGTNLYEYDFGAPDGHKIVAISHLATGSGFQGLSTVSSDLSHIYFVATGVLTTAPNTQNQKATLGQDNLYVYEPDPVSPGQHVTVYIATLNPADSSDWTGFNRRDKSGMQVTPDGRFLLFPSAAGLTPGDTATASQLFQYDAETGDLIRISICQGGYSCNNNGDVAIGRGRYEQSGDGAYVLFNSTVALVPQANASSGFNSVYEYHEGDVHLISDGRDTTGFASSHGSELAGMSPSGSDVYFLTGDPLLSSDTNTQVGIYDAHREGGFPQPGTQSVCNEERCQGELPQASTSQSLGSAGLSGAGNLSPSNPPASPPVRPRIKCSKGMTLSHRKCIKAKSRKKSKRVQVKKRPARKASQGNRRVK